jgi:type I restriction enzyme R subunit
MAKLEIDKSTKPIQKIEKKPVKQKAEIVILFSENDYPHVDRDGVCQEIFEQAENFKKYKG